MIITRRIRKAVREYMDWRRRRRLARILPEIMERKQRIAAARVRHGKVKPIVIEQQQAMLCLLRGK